MAFEMNQRLYAAVFRRQVTPSSLIAELFIGLRSQHVFNPPMVLIGQRADRQRVVLSRSPEIVASSNGDAGKPMIERDSL
jgi:hypothetical protein